MRITIEAETDEERCQKHLADPIVFSNVFEFALTGAGVVHELRVPFVRSVGNMRTLRSSVAGLLAEIEAEFLTNLIATGNRSDAGLQQGTTE